MVTIFLNRVRQSTTVEISPGRLHELGIDMLKMIKFAYLNLALKRCR